MDGFKPSQRKVLFACFKRNLKSEIKVAQLAGYENMLSILITLTLQLIVEEKKMTSRGVRSFLIVDCVLSPNRYVSEHAQYHHGEASLMGTIIGMAQNFVGSNNVNLLFPSGQFGTRLMGGSDAASPRYIFTKVSLPFFGRSVDFSRGLLRMH